MVSQKALFITFEGIEGAGKSTMMALLANHMRENGNTPVMTREPGGSRLGRRLRSMLLDCRQERISIEAELFLFLADRAQHLAEVILPALEAGQPVLCDRYVDSTIAYQGYGRGMDIDKLREANRIATDNLMPVMTVLLDLPAQSGLARAGERNRMEGTVISEGRFDSESLVFHERVRSGYLALAADEPERISIVDASRTPELVYADCMNCLERALNRG